MPNLQNMHNRELLIQSPFKGKAANYGKRLTKE